MIDDTIKTAIASQELENYDEYADDDSVNDDDDIQVSDDDDMDEVGGDDAGTNDGDW